MDVIIQENIYLRSKADFDASGLDFAAVPFADRMEMPRARAKGARCFIIGSDPYGEEFYRALEPGTLVARYGVGYDNVPAALCRERGILVTYTPGVLDTSVAELAMALIQDSARGVTAGSASTKAGGWNQVAGIQLRGATLAVIGMGRIGYALSEIAVHGFGMRLRVYARPGASAERAKTIADTVTGDFREAVRGADFVSLHLSLTPETRHFMNASRLGLLPPGSRLINTARGAVVDEAALFDALSAGTLSGAALDVFETEPYVPVGGKDLRTLPNVIMLPHVGSNTGAASSAIAQGCIGNVRHYLEGAPDRLVLIPELRTE